ncbi:MAG: hypothetical protein ACFB00_12275 [Parvularculaceae bacterium]
MSTNRLRRAASGAFVRIVAVLAVTAAFMASAHRLEAEARASTPVWDGISASTPAKAAALGVKVCRPGMDDSPRGRIARRPDGRPALRG